MANNKSEKKGSVGRGRPPEYSRFKKGKSGNPRGRPKGARNLKTDVMEELRESIVVTEGERPTRISKQRAIIKSLVNRTLRGDSRAAHTLMSVVFRTIDPEAESSPPSPALTIEEQEVLEALKSRLLENDNNVITKPAHSGAKKKKP